MSKSARRILGASTAEADVVLDQAFVHTPQYLAVVESRDYNFVVGRRGTGKSAICKHAASAMSAGDKSLLIALRSPKHDNIDLVGLIEVGELDYRIASEAVRLAFRIFLLHRLNDGLREHPRAIRAGRRSHHPEPSGDVPVSPKGRSYASFIADVMREYASLGIPPTEVPRRLAEDYQIASVQQPVAETIKEASLDVVILVDGLDEGWLPSEEATAVLGGLARGASQFDEEQSGIHVCLFVRDNMWRAIAHIDSDYSRDFEGRDIRLTWNKDMLLELTADRLRAVSFSTADSSIKAWNQFVGKDLQGRSGFEWCLQFTLHRPRDVIALLNRAYFLSKAAGQDRPSRASVLGSAREASVNRLRDLELEYAGILPGVTTLLESFERENAAFSYGDMLESLEDILRDNRFISDAASDFAILDDPRTAFEVLYSVGFLGVVEADGRAYFCHDGAPQGVPDPPLEGVVLVHPAYWRALELQPDEAAEGFASDIRDEYQYDGTPRLVSDIRLKRLGALVTDLGQIDTGRAGASDFEDWVARALRIVFSYSLEDIQARPSPDTVDRRDIVAFNAANSSFWKMIKDDWGCRQVVFELKNYEELKPNDFRQAAAYGGGEYGRLTFIVYRSDRDHLVSRERNRVAQMYLTSKHLNVLFPTQFIRKFLEKTYARKRDDYVERKMKRWFNTVVRRYAQIQS
jgi:hypothetical protein